MGTRPDSSDRDDSQAAPAGVPTPDEAALRGRIVRALGAELLYADVQRVRAGQVARVLQELATRYGEDLAEGRLWMAVHLCCGLSVSVGVPLGLLLRADSGWDVLLALVAAASVIALYAILWRGRGELVRRQRLVRDLAGDLSDGRLQLAEVAAALDSAPAFRRVPPARPRGPEFGSPTARPAGPRSAGDDPGRRQGPAASLSGGPG